MKKVISWILTLSMLLSLVPQMAIFASADDLAALEELDEKAGVMTKDGLKPGPNVFADPDSPTGYTVKFLYKNDEAEEVTFAGDIRLVNWADPTDTNVYTPYEYKPGLMRSSSWTAPMTKRADGYWYIEVPLAAGANQYWFYVDGNTNYMVPDPANHPLWSPNSNWNTKNAYNAVYIPYDEKQDFEPLKARTAENPREDGKTGTWSYVPVKLNGATKYLGVYLPYGYDPDREEPYKTIWTLHGGGQDESDWMGIGSVQNIMDNLVAEGRTEPAVIVTPNCSDLGGSFWGGGSNSFGTLFDTLFSFVENSYNVSADPMDRALCGLSMGSMYTQSIMNTDVSQFGYYGPWSGGASANPASFNAEGVNIFYGNGGSEADMSASLENQFRYTDVDYKYTRVAGAHDFNTWCQLYRIFLEDYLWDDDAFESMGPKVIKDEESPTGYTVEFRYFNDEVEEVTFSGDLMLANYADPTDNKLYSPFEYRPGLMRRGNAVFASNAGFSAPMENLGNGYWYYELPLAAGANQYWFTLPGSSRMWPDPANAPQWSPASDWNGKNAYNAVYVPYDEKQDNELLKAREIENPRPGQKNGTWSYVPYSIGASDYYMGVYLPYGYDAEREVPYKTVYVLHGGGQDESDWLGIGSVQNIVDNLYADGAIEDAPILIVPGTGNNRLRNANLEATFAFVEENYNVSTDRLDRAVCGLSAGAMMTNNILGDDKNREEPSFGYYGLFSGGQPSSVLNSKHLKDVYLYVANGRYEGSTFDQRYVDAGAFYYTTQVAGAHDFNTWCQLFTEFVRDFIWNPAAFGDVEVAAKEIDFTDPASAESFTVENQDVSVITEGEGLYMISTRDGFEPCDGATTEFAPKDVVKIDAGEGDWTATLKVDVHTGSGWSSWFSRGEYFGFYAMDDYDNFAGIRATNGAMQDIVRKDGEVTAATAATNSGLNALNNVTALLRIVKTDDDYACSVSTDGGLTFNELFVLEDTGIEGGTICIDAYSGSSVGYNYMLKSLSFADPCAHESDASVLTEVVVPATCTEAGYVDTVCELCGATKHATLPATGHTRDEGIITAPTCTEGGFTTFTCTVCGEEFTGDATPAAGHSWDSFVDTVEATETEFGTRVYTCSACEATKEVGIKPTELAVGPTLVEDPESPTGYTGKFIYEDSTAKQVYFCGDLMLSNDADPSDTNVYTPFEYKPGFMRRGGSQFKEPMTELADGYWYYEVPLAAGANQYWFNTDTITRMIPDPANHPQWSPASNWNTKDAYNAIWVPYAEVQGYDVLKAREIENPREGQNNGTWSYVQYDLPNEKGCYMGVYLPYGYDAEREEPYKTIYVLHGGGQDESDWLGIGSVQNIVDNLYADGAIKDAPILIVPRNTRLGTGNLEATFAFIEENYNVSSDRMDRAICGLSMGGMMINSLLNDDKNREGPTFGYYGFFSGGQPSNALTSPYLLDSYYYVASGKQEGNPYSQDLVDTGAYCYFTQKAGAHDFNTWNQLFTEYVRDFAFNPAAFGDIKVCEHVWDKGEITVDPTSTEDGEMTYTCTLCGETKVEVIPAFGDGVPALKDLYGKYFRIGTCIGSSEVQREAAQQFILKNYNTVTCENEMKPQYTLDQAASQAMGDNVSVQVTLPANTRAILDFCQANGIPMRGHVICWHSQTPAWLFREGFTNDGEFVSPEIMDQRLESYIKNLFGTIKAEYPDLTFYAFDVVNEAFTDTDPATMRTASNSNWIRIYGDDSFIYKAFEYADKYAPEDCMLCYNDYNEYNAGKVDAIYELAKNLYEKGWLDAVGMQTHLSIPNNPTIETYRAAVEKFASIGCKIMVTEMDAQIGPGGEAEQAEYYSELFKVFVDYADVIDAVVFWGTQDANSWRSTSNPLAFSSNYQPKPAFYSIVDVVSDHEHIFKEVVTAPTCTEQGYTSKVCRYCGRSIVEDYTAPLGHTWDEGEITVAPTEKKAGVKTFTCTVCGATKTARVAATEATWPADIDFADPAFADRFEIVNPETAAIVVDSGLALASTSASFETAGENFAGKDVITIPVSGDFNATLKFNATIGSAFSFFGESDFLGFFLMDDLDNGVGLRAGNNNIVNFAKVDGVVTANDAAVGASAAKGLNTNDRNHWYKISKSGDDVIIYYSADGATYDKLFTFEDTGLEGKMLVIDAYKTGFVWGNSNSNSFNLESIYFDSADEIVLVPGPSLVADPESPTGYTGRFIYFDDEAEQVYFCGDLMLSNDADPTDTKVYTPFEYKPGLMRRGGSQFKEPMEYLGDGYWYYELPLAAGANQYWFNTDTNTRMLPDPANHPQWSPASNWDTKNAYNAIYVPYADVQDYEPLKAREIENPRPGQNNGTWSYVPYSVGGRDYYMGVYLPYGYDAEREVPYKTVYVLHGGGQDESDWLGIGSVQNIVDNLYADGAIEDAPVLIVPGTGSNRLRNANLEATFAFVEENYNVSSDRMDRAICGLSMGAMQINSIIGDDKNREEPSFGYYGPFSGGAPSNALTSPYLYDMYLYVGNGKQEGRMNMSSYESARANYYYTQKSGAHDFNTWCQLFTEFVRDYIWQPAKFYTPGPVVVKDPESPTGYTGRFIYFDDEAEQVYFCGDLMLSNDADPFDTAVYTPFEYKPGFMRRGGSQFKEPMENLGDGYWFYELPLAAGANQYWFNTESNTRMLPDPANHPLWSPASNWNTKNAYNAIYVPYDEVQGYEPLKAREIENPRARQNNGTWSYVPYSVGGRDYYMGVYLPYGYDAEREVPYKTVYVLHGGGQDESDWLGIGSVNNIVDNLYADGAIEDAPVLIVPGTGSNRLRNANLEATFAFVEEHYNVSSDRMDRAICGLSAGGMQINSILGDDKNREEPSFGYYGFFSGGQPSNALTSKYLLDSYYYVGSGKQEGNPYNQNLVNTGAACYFTQKAGAHDFNTWNQLFTEFVRDFVWNPAAFKALASYSWSWHTDAKAPSAQMKINWTDGSVSAIEASMKVINRVGNEITYEARAVNAGVVYTATKTVKNTYKVTVEGGTVITGVKSSYSYGDKIIVRADVPEGKAFAGWYVGETLVSTSEIYGRSVTADFALRAEFADEAVEPKPAFSVSSTDRVYDDASGKNKTTLTLEWSLPTGYTLVSAGLYRAYADIAPTKDTVISTGSQTVAKTTASNGVYNLNLSIGASNSARDLYYVGYVTYKDATGAEYTVSSDVFCNEPILNTDIVEEEAADDR